MTFNLNIQIRMIQTTVAIVDKKRRDHLKKIKRRLEMIQEKHLRVMAEKVIMTVKLMNIQNRMIQTTV